ncbi:MAG: sugar phosphate nucleotidyltransferase, partial [Candidatus Zixiibacteriota bacterium]
DPLRPLKPKEVVLVIGANGDVIRKYVQRHYSFKTIFVHQEKLHGLGYALHLALADMDDGPVMIILGDTIVECDLRAFCRAGDYVLGLRQVDDPYRFGIAEIAHKYVVNLEEKPKKPKSNLALIGLYYFKEPATLKQALARLVEEDRRTRGEIQLTDALHKMIEAGVKFVPFEVEGWYDCGKKETLLSTNRHLLSKLPPAPDIDGSTLIRPVFVDPEAKVINSVLGPNVSVSEHAVIENSILRDSIVGAGARVENVVLEDSLIGAQASVVGQMQVINIGERSQVRIS